MCKLQLLCSYSGMLDMLVCASASDVVAGKPFDLAHTNV